MIDIENYLGNFFKGTKGPSLDAMQYFMDEYNNFQKEMKFIHIAGTNGKGSCTEIISNILINQGYKVGKFLSPHLIKFNERISINGKDISDKEMSDLIEELEPKMKKYNKSNITLFELETVMALLYFYRNNVDFVVLETGLGGLYDCTNIISHPLVSVITSIGFDHMNLLGDTLPKIAYQKAGIIKEGSDTVFFGQAEEVNSVFVNVCNDKNNKLHLLSEGMIANYSYDNNFQYFDFGEFRKIAVNLKGIKQIHNAAICIESIKVLNRLGYEVSEESLRIGLSTVRHRGRMEVLNKNPLIIYDGAHNEPAIENLQMSVDMYYKDFRRVYIISILKTKDYVHMLRILLKDKNATFIFTSGNNEERYVAKEKLYEVALKYRKEAQMLYMKSLDEAIEFIFSNDENMVNFIVGSFYVYSTVNELIEKITKR